MIVQNVAADGRGRHLLHRARATTCRATLEAVDEAAKELGAEGVQLRRQRVEDLGRRPGHGHADRAWPARCSAPWPTQGINIQMITTSEIKISVLVAREHAAGGPADRPRGVPAATARRPAPTRPATAAAAAAAAPATPRPIVARLATHGRADRSTTSRSTSRRPGVTISGVPDMPGLAAQVFDDDGRGGHLRRHDRAERRPRRPRQPQLHRAAEAIWTRASSCRASLAEPLGCGAADQLPAGGQALGLRHRHAEPHRRGHPHVPARWPRRASTSR